MAVTDLDTSADNTRWNLRADDVDTVFEWPATATRSSDAVPSLAAGTVGTVTADGFAPLSPVVVDLHSMDSRATHDLARGDTDELGTYHAEVALPADVNGDHVIRIASAGADGSLRAISLGINIEASPASLPATGSNNAPLLWAVLFASIGGLVVIRRGHTTG